MHLFFSTPIWTYKVDNFKNVNQKALEYISSLQKIDPLGKKRSNINGWHSNDFDMNSVPSKELIKSFKPSINTALKDMDWDLEKQDVKITNMWAIINYKGSFNQKHHHGNSDLSAAYYLSAGKDCGNIVFYDPRPAPTFKHPIAKKANILNASINSVTPEEGLLVLFPSYVEHSVSPNLSNEKRVVISFNISLEKKRD